MLTTATRKEHPLAEPIKTLHVSLVLTRLDPVDHYYKA
jgi:hypothetical protein